MVHATLTLHTKESVVIVDEQDAALTQNKEFTTCELTFDLLNRRSGFPHVHRLQLK